MSDQTPSSAQLNLAVALESAAEGGIDQLRTFFSLLCSSTLLVPTRQQERPVHNSATYPDEFLNLLALEEQERIFVPCFSDPAAIKEWYAGALNVREIEFSALNKLLPQDWWIVLNPSSDACKELSPWELERLRGGDQELAELLDELRQSEIGSPVRIEALAQDQVQSLRQALIGWADQNDNVAEIYLAREYSTDYSELHEKTESHVVQSATLLVGVAIKHSDSALLAQIQDQASVVAAAAMIGDESPRLLSGAIDSVALGVFKGIEPIYKAKGGLINSLLNRIKSKR